jgi:protein phosphatase
VHEPEPDLFSVPVEAGDRVLLCSDGCSGVLDPEEMARLLGADSLDEAATGLVRAALEAGSSDNVTVVVAAVVAESPASTPAPLVVGAAATTPHRRLADDATGNLSEGDLAALGDEDLDGLDPEELRYAPRPPRRFLWTRRLAVLGVLLLLVGLGAGALYSWSQGQYYVSDDSGDVVIFKGVKAQVPGVATHHVAERTGLTLADLESYDASRVRSGISAEDLKDARRIVEDLKIDCPTPTPSPAPTTTRSKKPSPSATPAAPTPTPTTTATVPAPCATLSPSPSPTTPAATPAASPAATPAATPGATP